MRAFGKGFEDLYMRSKAAGVRYVRGLPGEVEEDPETRGLRVFVENTTAGRLEQHVQDMLVLSIGAEPRRDGAWIKQLLTLSNTADGFYMEAHPKLRPVDAPTKGVFLAGCAEAPKDVKDSVTQAGAAAARVGALLNKSQITVEAITAVVDEDLCKKCGQCAAVCPYGAIAWQKGQVANVITAACAGCGTCAAECRFEAIAMRHFSDQAVYAQIDAMLSNSHKPAVTFACNWCSYAGADTAGTGRMQYPPNALLVRTMCSGRVAPDFVWYAFRKGAPAVLVSGCHLADCHYINANRVTVRRVDALWDGLEKHGVRPERLQLEWCSAAEGQRWAKIMAALEEKRANVTEEEIEATREALREAKVPVRSKLSRVKQATMAAMHCLRCGHTWDGGYDPEADVERTCPACRSSSVRIMVQ
jgi:heterodisulfide reductase subunit A